MKPRNRNLLLWAGVGVGLAWVGSRIVMAIIWWQRCQYIASDVAYYFQQMRQPAATALAEYPTPILWLMRLLHWLSGGDYGVFLDLVIVLMVLLDALVTVALFWRASPLAAAYWVVFLALLGPIIWFRIDLIPAACVTLGLLVLSRRPRLSGALLALGAATKLWPALLILPSAGRDKAARRRLLGFAATGAAIAALSLVLDGWGRSVSPIGWQSERGLQIESLAATWPMILHASRPWAVTVSMSPFHAYEVFGQGVAAGLVVASVLMVVAVCLTGLLTALLAVWPSLHPSPAADKGRHAYAVLLAATAVVAAMIAANKTFSPQYLIWLAGPLGLVLARAKTPGERRAGAAAGLLGCVAAGLTQAVFPLAYGGLLTNPLGSAGVTALLVARNAVMATLTVLLMVWALRAAWRAVRPTG